MTEAVFRLVYKATDRLRKSTAEAVKTVRIASREGRHIAKLIRLYRVIRILMKVYAFGNVPFLQH
jgi:hypothetical protein